MAAKRGKGRMDHRGTTAVWVEKGAKGCGPSPAIRAFSKIATQLSLSAKFLAKKFVRIFEKSLAPEESGTEFRLVLALGGQSGHAFGQHNRPRTAF